MVKSRYWVAIMYLENMIDEWQDRIAELLQVPFAYCIHDKDLEKDGKTPRKPHVHVMIAYTAGTTTQKNALNIFKQLEKQGCSAIPNDVIQQVFSVRNQYDYLIHDTEDCKKKHKHLYDKAARVTGNGFDIGIYEQISTADKLRMKKELANVICENEFTNYMKFYKYVVSNFDDEYFDIMSTHTSFFKELVKGNYFEKYHTEQPCS